MIGRAIITDVQEAASDQANQPHETINESAHLSPEQKIGLEETARAWFSWCFFWKIVL